MQEGYRCTDKRELKEIGVLRTRGGLKSFSVNGIGYMCGRGYYDFMWVELLGRCRLRRGTKVYYLKLYFERGKGCGLWMLCRLLLEGVIWSLGLERLDTGLENRRYDS